jgi:transposase
MVNGSTFGKRTFRCIGQLQCEIPNFNCPKQFHQAVNDVGVLYLVTSDTTLSYDDMTTIYRTRWNVEPYHKSLKQNASLEKSPAQTVTTQTNHFFAAVCAFIKLEMLKSTTQLNHFALKTKPYVNALQEAFSTLRELKPVQFVA